MDWKTLISGGLIVALATGIPAFLALLHNQRVQEDARFFEAIKLLGSASSTSRLAAITILQELASKVTRLHRVIFDALLDHLRTFQTTK